MQPKRISRRRGPAKPKICRFCEAKVKFIDFKDAEAVNTVLEVGEKGGCVIIGRAADYILRDNPRLTSVFIHASYEYREARIMEYEHISADKARDMINKADKKKAAYYNFATEKKWGAASSYNLTLDTSEIGIDGCVTMIRKYLELKKAQKG